MGSARRRSTRLMAPPKASTKASETIDVTTNSQRSSSMPRETPIASRTGRRKK